MLLRGYGMDTRQRSLHLEEEDVFFPIGIGGSHDLHDLTLAQKGSPMITIQDEIPLYRRN